MNNLVTKRLSLIPFKQELVQAAIKGDGELAKVLGIKILPNSLGRNTRQHFGLEIKQAIYSCLSIT